MTPSGQFVYIKLNFILRPIGTEMPSPVTIKGWLYKRGNDGLKLWKKRYFVLTEYCLSYYKGAHDEKASGTILLPSYRYAFITILLAGSCNPR